MNLLILFASLVGLAFVFVTLSTVVFRGKPEILEPFGLFALSYAFVYFLVPALQWLWPAPDSLYSASGSASDEICFVLLYAILYFAVAFCGYLYGRPKAQQRSVYRVAATCVGREEKGLVALLICIELFSAVRIWQLVSGYLGVNYATFMMERIHLTAGKGYELATVLVGIPAALLLSAPILAPGGKKSWRGVLLTIACLTVVVVCSLMLGRRIDVIVSGLWLACSWVLLRGSTSTTALRLGLLAGAILLAATFLGSLRQQISVGEADSGSLETKGSVSAELLAQEIAGNFGQVEWLADARLKSDQWIFAYGRTYLAGLLMPVPRAWWHGKPVGAGPMLGNILRPNMYDVDSDTSSSVTTGCLAEAYLNGGPIGVVVIAFLHGLALAKLSRYGARVRKRYQYVMYLVTMLLLSQNAIFAEFAGTVERFGLTVGIVWFYCVIRRLFTGSLKTPATKASWTYGRVPEWGSGGAAQH